MAKKMYKAATIEMIAVYRCCNMFGNRMRYIEAVLGNKDEARRYVADKKLSGVYSSSDFMLEPVSVRMKAWDGVQRDENLI